MTLGTMTFGGQGFLADAGRTAVDEARELIAQSRDAGVNFFDTANVYSTGESERILGEALGDGIDDVLIATKVGMKIGDGPNDRGLSRNHIIEQCEQSLRNLGRDHIDLYQVHAWDGLTPLEETLATLGQLVDDGKVRYIGCSNYSAWHIVKALGVADREHLPGLVVTQSFNSLGVGAESLRKLIVGAEPDESLFGIGLAIVSLIVMPLLPGRSDESARSSAARAVAADATETALCVYLSAILLVGFALNAMCGWWWPIPSWSRHRLRRRPGRNRTLALSLTRFDRHPPLGAQPRKGCPS